MIYPKDSLTEIKGKKIKSMKFYPTNTINFNGGKFTVKMGTTTQTVFPSSTYSRITEGMTEVKANQAAVSGKTELLITFDEPFEYTGDNLVIDFEVTTTGTRSSSQNFYGVSQNGTYPAFYSYGTSTNDYGRYTSGSRRAFLPKVTFTWDVEITAGTVRTEELTFIDIHVGKTQDQTITITNTGNQTFTPVIDTTNLPAEFTITGTGEILPGGRLDLTVTYAPTDEGPHSGSFTVTIGDQAYTIIVTGNGIFVSNTLTSNEVVVPVFKSEAQGIDNDFAYQVSDIDGDTKHLLPTGSEDGDMSIQVVGNSNITRYELNRQSGSSSWSVVAVANHSGNDYTQQGYSDNTVTVADGATEWMRLIDNAGISSNEAVYVPVTHALSVQQNDNTYGAPRQTKTVNDMSAVVQSIVMSSAYAGGQPWTENGKVYTHYTILLDIDQLIIPTSDTDPTKDYDLYKVRAWRKVDPSLLNERYYEASTGNSGKNRQERLTEDGEFLFEELGYDEYSLTSVTNRDNKYYLGDNSNLTSFYPNWTSRGTNEVMATFGAQKLRENEDETGVIEELSMVFTVRAYYTRTANLESDEEPTRDGESAADGKYYILEYELPLTLNAYDDEIITAVGSIFADRQVVDVTYVNALGMQSSEPFDGLNIVVTRYDDGSVTTLKVIK